MGKIIGLVIKDKKCICPHCGREYKSEDALNKHIEKEHSENMDDK